MLSDASVLIRFMIGVRHASLVHGGGCRTKSMGGKLVAQEILSSSHSFLEVHGTQVT